MKPFEGLIFTIGKYQYKISRIDDAEVVAVRLDSDGNPTEKTKKFAIGLWPPEGAIFEEDKQKGKAGKSYNDASTNSRRTEEPPHSDDNIGEAPEFPPIFFTYDPLTNKLEVRDRRGNVKAEFTVKTETGASAYELWKKGQVEGVDTSFTAYMKDMRGIDGKNGKNAFEEWQDSRDPDTDRSWDAYLKFFTGDKGESAFEQWKKVHGEYCNPTIDDFFNYFKGQNGKDAYEVWQEMGFQDRSREDFFKWIASLVETQKGEDGKIYYPHFDGHVIYFTEDIDGKGARFIEKDIRGKDGRTFDPVFEGTKLHFEDGEGLSTDPVELKGKDAFELWKEYHHKPDATYEEFEEYFKGQNVQSPHTYMEVKDWQCPVQNIDTDLIINSFHPAKSPSSFIEERKKTIKSLRDEGNKIDPETKRRKHWAGPLKEFTWWCAGADKGLLRMCPGDHSKYTGIGTVILFTALMAWFSSFIAIQLVFDPIHIPLSSIDSFWYKAFGHTADGHHYLNLPLAAILFASFWSAMIFFLDRFITNTMYSDGKVTISKQEFLSGLPRILIAIFLGIVISAPLELKIFEKEIDEYIVNEKIQKVENDLKEKDEYKEACNYYQELIDKSNKAYKEWKDLDPKSKKYEKDSSIINTVKNGTIIYEKSDGTLGDKDSYKNVTTNKVVFDHAQFNKDNDSLKIDYKTILLQRDNFSKIKKHIEDSLRREITNQYNNVDSVGLYERLNAMHALAMKEGEEGGYSHLFSSESVTEDGSLIINKKWDLLFKLILSLVCTAFFILLFIKKEKNENADAIGKSSSNNKIRILFAVLLSIIFGSLIGYNYELIHYILYFLTTPIGLIMLLFILIDISPVLYKMMLADGVYDKYLQQEKLLAQDTIRLNNAQMLRQIEKGELKSVSPFIMGDIYKELKGSAISGKDSSCNEHIAWANGDSGYNLEKDIEDNNKRVFDIVLDYKKRIILASYAAWYRDMRDSMIGKKDDLSGAEIQPEKILNDDE